MDPREEEILFHTPTLFAGTTGVVDHDRAVIHGVSLITGDCVAEGHDLTVDNTTVTQLHELAKGRGKVPVNLDHGTGIASTCGYISEFRLDGNKLRGDWHLLKSHDETVKMLERAEVMPDCFGLSVAFKGPPKGVMFQGKKCARAEKLLAVDCVTRPAANEGLFSARDGRTVDIFEKGMAEQSNPSQEPTLADVMAALQNISARQDAFEQSQTEIIDHINSSAQGPQGEEGDGVTREQLEQLYHASDQDLAQLGLTRDEVEAAVDDYNSSLDQGQQGDYQQGNGQYPGPEGNYQGGYEGGGQGQGEMAGAGAGGGAETTAAFRALARDVVQLKAHIAATELAARQQGEEIQFAEIDEKVTTLAVQRDKAMELAELLVSENEALKLAVKTGTRPVSAGVDNGVRLFGVGDSGELHEFQSAVKNIKTQRNCSDGQAIMFAARENPAAHADWLESQRR